MLCDKCGAENLDNGRFCTMCGLPFGEEPPKSKKSVSSRTVIVTAAVVIAAVMVLVFTVIVSRFSNRGRLKHVWLSKDNGTELTLDFSENTGTLENMLKFPIEIDWTLDGDRLSLTMLYKGEPLEDTEEFIVSFDDGGRVMRWSEVGAPSSVKEFTRLD
ncbi:MAG: zinc ribbon domain-containing protein [Oscillospiraceae bacterium]|nr:zinc ribbon domain-containing protein [Oscillospiraceae bacterium]